MALEDFLPPLAAQIGTINGLDGRVYYPHPADVDGNTGLPAQLDGLLCATLIPVDGEQMFGGSYIASHNLELVIYVCQSESMKISPTVLGLAVPYIRLMRDKLASRYKLGRPDLIDEVMPTGGRWYEGPKGFTYADLPYAGVKFFITVKEHQPFTLAA